jgi:glycine/D-amino acid oxidase-like deaminating enzyme
VPDASTPLRATVLADWRRLEAELADLRVRWTGSLLWGDERLIDEQRLAPDEHVVAAAEVLRLEPALRVAPARALHKTTDGAVDPVAATEALVRGAREHDASLRAGVLASGLRVRNGRVSGVETSHGFVPADTVVVAAGADAPVLCASLGVPVPVEPSPSVLLRFAAPAGLVRTIVANGRLEARTAADGHLLVAAEYAGEASQDDVRQSAGEVRRALLDLFAVEAADLFLVGGSVGMRPMPADGLPIVGSVPGVPGLYLALLHSGVTLAPVVGRLVSDELVDGVDAEELRGLRPAAQTP